MRLLITNWVAMDVTLAQIYSLPQAVTSTKQDKKSTPKVNYLLRN